MCYNSGVIERGRVLQEFAKVGEPPNQTSLNNERKKTMKKFEKLTKAESRAFVGAVKAFLTSNQAFRALVGDLKNTTKGKSTAELNSLKRIELGGVAITVTQMLEVVAACEIEVGVEFHTYRFN